MDLINSIGVRVFGQRRQEIASLVSHHALEPGNSQSFPYWILHTIVSMAIHRCDLALIGGTYVTRKYQLSTHSQVPIS